MKRNSQVKQRTLSGENTSREEYSAPFGTTTDADLLFAVAEDAANGVLPQVETVVLSWEVEEDKRVAVVTVVDAPRRRDPAMHQVEIYDLDGKLWIKMVVHDALHMEPTIPWELRIKGYRIFIDGEQRAEVSPLPLGGQ